MYEGMNERMSTVVLLLGFADEDGSGSKLVDKMRLAENAQKVRDRFCFRQVRLNQTGPYHAEM
jgi:hypothetical protein